MADMTGSELRRLQNLLRQPVEDLDLEVKGWPNLDDPGDKAQLAKAAMALANHGGGKIVLGFNDKTVPPQSAAPRPGSLDGYHQDKVSNIIKRFAEPRFQCKVAFVPHPETNDFFPVVIVPGGRTSIIRAKSEDPKRGIIKYGEVYIRAPGPESKPAETREEWDDLHARIARNVQAVYGVPAPLTAEEGRAKTLREWHDQSTERFCTLVREKLSHEAPTRYANGRLSISYNLEGDLPELALEKWQEVLHQVESDGTGRPLWPVVYPPPNKPHPYNETLEAWLGWDDPQEVACRSEYWRVSPDGFLYQTVGYVTAGVKMLKRPK